MKASKSYFACITPRSSCIRETRKEKGIMVMLKDDSIESILNGESFSTPSVADFDILRCNVRASKGTRMGEHLWVLIEALGVMSIREDKENVRLINKMESRDREGVAVKKGNHKKSP